LSPLHRLRFYLHSHPRARSALLKGLGFGGVSLVSLNLSTPIRLDAREQSTMADADSEEIRGRTQQAPLASQRARDQGQSQPGRFAQWFPLGAKEGFNQWVSATTSNATALRPSSAT